MKFGPKGTIDNNTALAQIMVWRKTGDNPLHEPMVAQVVEAYMRHSASVSEQVGQQSRTACPFPRKAIGCNYPTTT